MKKASKLLAACGASALLCCGLALTACSGAASNTENANQASNQATNEASNQAEGEAQASLVDIDINASYDIYDVTGDGTADTFRIKMEEPSGSDDDYFCSSTKVKVNGETALKFGGAKKGLYYYGGNAKLATLANGQVFLSLILWGEDDSTEAGGLYRYENAEEGFKQVVDFTGFFGEGYGSHESAEIDRVEGSSIFVKHSLMSAMLGAGFTATYEYQCADDGTLSQLSNQTSEINVTTMNDDGTVNDDEAANEASNEAANTSESSENDGYLTCQTTLKGYDTPQAEESTATFEYGTMMKPIAVFVDDGDFWVQFDVKDDGEYWVPSVTFAESTSQQPFKEIFYAG